MSSLINDFNTESAVYYYPFYLITDDKNALASYGITFWNFSQNSSAFLKRFT